MLLTEQNILMYDLERLFHVARKASYMGFKKKETDDILRTIKPLKLSLSCCELDFLDLRIVDGVVKKMIHSMVEHLKLNNIILDKKEILRDLSGYFVFDETRFTGIDIVKPALYFGEEAVFYPKGFQRKTQALIRYPEHISEHLKKGRQFSYITTVGAKDEFVPTKKELVYFNYFVHIVNQKTHKKCYFGVWE